VLLCLVSLLPPRANQCAQQTLPTRLQPTAVLRRRAGPLAIFAASRQIADIANLSWVNKRCRLWAADGDIDIDQTCLVVRTVAGGLVVIPNEYVDKEMKEIAGELGRETRDKCIQRFYNIGGGEKSIK
jgi:hypothetical protein